MKHIKVFIFILGVLSSFYCSSQQPTKTSPRQAEEIRIAIIDYMECEECTEGQLKKLVNYGSKVVPSLERILKEGPSDAKKETLLTHLQKSYRDLVAYQQTHPENKVTMKEDEYIKTYMDNYVALYQSRAIVALTTIGGPTAKKALQSASDIQLRADVKTVLDENLKKL